jgi:bifunctional non-homologous end joining protein LigD
VGGYKPADRTFESILVGYFDEQQLYFAGQVRAGFTPHLRHTVMASLADLQISQCPFVNLPNSTGRSHWGEGITIEDMRSLRWVRPSVVVEVAFTEWTADALLRHASFVALRDDKSARDIRRDAGEP